LTLPVQFLYVLANLIARLPGDGSFACANLHAGSIQPCTFSDMLANALFSVLLANIASAGIFFAASAFVVAFVLAVLRKLRSPRAPRATISAADDSTPSWMRDQRFPWWDPWWKIW
jgi:hypothetical protein